MSNNHNDTHRKKRGIKEYTLDKQYKVCIEGAVVISYDDSDLARYCMNVLNRNQGGTGIYAWLES